MNYVKIKETPEVIKASAKTFFKLTPENKKVVANLLQQAIKKEDKTMLVCDTELIREVFQNNFEEVKNEEIN